jgi:hypothetical protein
MFALVRMVEPTQREFVVTIPQDRIGKKTANTLGPEVQSTASGLGPEGRGHGQGSAAGG